jgi:hypothetical protein
VFVQIDWTSVLARCSLEQPLVGLLCDCLLIMSCLIPFSATCEDHSAFFAPAAGEPGVAKEQDPPWRPQSAFRCSQLHPTSISGYPMDRFRHNPAAAALLAGLSFSQGRLNWQWRMSISVSTGLFDASAIPNDIGVNKRGAYILVRCDHLGASCILPETTSTCGMGITTKVVARLSHSRKYSR